MEDIERQKLHSLAQQIYYTFLKLKADAKTIHDCQIDLISRLGLELNPFSTGKIGKFDY